MADLLRPNDLLQMASEAELAEMEKERRLKQKKQQQDLDLREAFMTRKVAPEAIERINHAVSVAAKRGEHQIRRLAVGNPADRHLRQPVALAVAVDVVAPYDEFIWIVAARQGAANLGREGVEQL